MVLHLILYRKTTQPVLTEKTLENKNSSEEAQRISKS